VLKGLLHSDVSDEILKIVLFGSCARGQDRPDSDIDLLIVLRKDGWDVTDRIYQLVTDVILTYGRDISLKLFSRSEFQQLVKCGTVFMKQVEGEGQIVYERTRLCTRTWLLSPFAQNLVSRLRFGSRFNSAVFVQNRDFVQSRFITTWRANIGKPWTPSTNALKQCKKQ
jgi:predicted nucleotidyltransferase